MNNKNGKFKFKIDKKRLIIPFLVVLTFTLWPAHLSKTDAAVLASVSPLAVPVRNLWGAPKGETVDAALYRSDSALGWSWSRPNPVKQPGVSYIQPIYPSARITLKAPVAVGDIQSFNLFADYNYTQKPTGKYNLAFDIFLREKGKVGDNRKSEIMVWLDGTQKQPLLSFKGSCSDGHNTYKKYWWTTADGWAYRSFLLEKAPNTTSCTVDLKALIDLIKLDKDWYISEIELGTEVWSGTGAVELTNFYLELNGVRL